MTLSEILNFLAEKKNLDFEEASLLMEMILEGRIDPPQTAAVLMGLKSKGETTTEIAAFANAMRAKSLDMSIEGLSVLDTCGTGGDLCHTFNISTLASLIAAGAGCHIAKHGNRSISSQCGSADVLQALGVNIQEKPEKTKELIKTLGIGFLFAPDMHPAMKNVMPVRKSLGIRTVFNMLGPLTNPAKAKRQIIGVFDEGMGVNYAKVLLEMGHEEAYIVHGKDGLDEITIGAATKIVHLKDGKILEFEVTPEEFGIKRTDKKLLTGGDASANAKILLDILKGEKSPKRDIACLNAAFVIKLGSKATDLHEAYRIACETIDSGKAIDVLQKWIDSSRK